MVTSGSDRNPVEELAEEFLERFRRGERPTLTEYTSRYPELAAQIRDLFPALVLMEDVRPGAADATGSFDGGTMVAEGRKRERLGEYRILREVGRGGMGVVYEALQESVGRHVALKVLHGHALADPSYLERFKREVRAAGRLHHTNIVPVFGTGECDGVHYYAMQFIPGQGLDAVLRDLRRLRRQRSGAGEPAAQDKASADASIARSLLTGTFHQPPEAGDQKSRGTEQQQSTGEKSPGGVSSASLLVGSSASGEEGASHARPQLSEGAGGVYYRSVARVGVQVAEALAYAHKQGILHRDIKPSNLLLDLQGTAWVTDFGLAKAEGTDELTHAGDIVGTIRFMAPERFEGHSLPQSDVYGLGLTLYELLTLQAAFEDSDRVRLIERVRREEPPRPRQLDPRLPRDLETIVLRAIAKDPGQRYPTAEALAEDLRRFLADRTILARRSSWGERAWRWCYRNPVVASLIAAVALLLVGAAVASLAVAIRMARDSKQIAAARDEADQNAHNAEQARQQEQGERRRAEDGARQARRQLARFCVANGTRLVEEGNRLGSLVWFAEALKQEPDDPARIEMQRTRLGAVLRQCPRLVQIWFEKKPVYHVAFSRDGRRVAIASGDLHFMSRATGEVRVLDAVTGEPIAPPLKHTHPVYHVAFSTDGRRLVTGSGGYVPIGERTSRTDGEVRVWDLTSGKQVTPPLKHTTTVNEVSFSPDGASVIALSGSQGHGMPGEVRIWDLATGKTVGKPFTHNRVHYMTISPEGKRVAVGSWMDAGVWDLARGEPTTPLMGHGLKLIAPGARRGGVNHVAFSPDGLRLVTASGDDTACVWDAATGKAITPSLRHSDKVNCAAFSPDGRRVVTASDDETACVWDAVTGTPITRLIRHQGHVIHVAFSPDGRQVLTISGDAPVRPSDTGGYQTVRVWDAETGKAVSPVLQHNARVASAVFSPEGRRVLTASMDGIVRLWEIEPGEPVKHLFKPGGRISHAAFSLDGGRLFVKTVDGAAHVWQPGKDGTTALPVKLSGYVNFLAFSPDGRRVLTANGLSPYGPFRHGEERAHFADTREARVWDAATGRPVTPPLQHDSHVYQAAFSPDGRRVVTASEDKTARVWEVVSGKPITEPLRHGDRVMYAAFSPDGRRVVTASWDGKVRVWDVATGQTVGAILKPDGSPNHASFSPDGRAILTVGYDRTARLWEVATGKLLAPPLKYGGHLHDASFHAGGCRILVALDQVARVWDVSRGEPITPPLRHGDLVTHAVFSPDGRRVVTTSIDGTGRVWDAVTGEPVTPPLPHGSTQGERWSGPYGRSDVPRTVFTADGQRVATVANTGALVWDLRPDERPVQDLARLALLLAGHTIDSSGGSVPVSPDELRQAWQALRAQYPGQFTSSFREPPTRPK